MLLEPVMAVEVVTPEDFLGDVIGDLSRRRGKVQGQEPRGNALAVQAFVPLGEMFGYATDLRSSTQGRANYTMQFERYEEVPDNIAEEIVEHRSGEPVGAPPRAAAARESKALSGYISQVRLRATQIALQDAQILKHPNKTEKNNESLKGGDVQGEVRAR